MPTPPAEFSPFTTTKSSSWSLAQAGQQGGQRAPAETAHHVADEQELHRGDSAKLSRRGDERRSKQPRAGRAACAGGHGPDQALRRPRGPEGRVPVRRPRRAGGDHRPQRRRQDHAALDPGRDPAPRRGQRVEGPGRDRLGPAAGRRSTGSSRWPRTCELFARLERVPDPGRHRGPDARALGPARPRRRPGGHALGRQPPAREHRHRAARRGPRCCCSTSRARRWTRASASASGSSSCGSRPRAPRSSTPPTTSRRRTATPAS